MLVEKRWPSDKGNHTCEKLICYKLAILWRANVESADEREEKLRRRSKLYKLNSSFAASITDWLGTMSTTE